MEFNRCPECDSILEDWAKLYPNIRGILELDPLKYEKGETACYTLKIEELAKIKDPVNYEKNIIELGYGITEDEIYYAMTKYGGGAWELPEGVEESPKLRERRKSVIKSKVRETRHKDLKAEQEKAYINNIFKEWDKYKTPKADQGEYYINGSGIYREVDIAKDDGRRFQVRKEVCRTPFVICGVSENDEVYYKVRFQTSQTKEIREFWASQSTLLSKKELKTLFLSRGINCPENALLNETVEYISRSIAEFSSFLKKEFAIKQCGWNEDRNIFVLGEKRVSIEGIEPILAVGAGRGFPELTKLGTEEEWVDGVKELIRYRVIRFKCYDALTAILNLPLGVESHISDHYGNTSVGKTFTAWIALSLIGDPEGLTIGAKSSSKGILVTVRDFSDLPLLVDESSDAGEHLADLIYPLTSNKGRMKSTQDGRRDGGEEYHTSIMFTGEKPIRDCLKNSGQQYRVIEIDDTLPDLPTKEINKVKRTIRDNHGHVIELFLQEVIKKMTDGSLYITYDECFDKLPDNISNIEGRSRSIFACIMTAGKILEPIFQKLGIPAENPEEIVKHYYKKCIIDKPVELEYIRALRVSLDWINSDYGRFLRYKKGYDDENVIDKATTYGFVNENYIDIIESEFTKKMKSEGFSPTKIKDDWNKQGITVSNDKNRKGSGLYRTSNKKYGPYAAIRINRTIAGELVGYNDIEKEEETEVIPELDQYEKISLIFETINLLTKVWKKADIAQMRAILPYPELDEYLHILSTNGKIRKLSQTEYLPL